ncbi:MAG: hypothetical protein ABIP75_11560 [Pyrinomonadaceae bacterium]
MSSITEIEAAIEKLPPPQIDELAVWIDELRIRRAVPPHVEDWLDGARGAATAGLTTEQVLALTRGEE